MLHSSVYLLSNSFLSSKIVALSNTLDVFDIFMGLNSDVSCISIDGINIASVFDILLLETDPFGNVVD
jgi:hypothetical protein